MYRQKAICAMLSNTLNLELHRDLELKFVPIAARKTHYSHLIVHAQLKKYLNVIKIYTTYSNGTHFSLILFLHSSLVMCVVCVSNCEKIR